MRGTGAMRWALLRACVLLLAAAGMLSACGNDDETNPVHILGTSGSDVVMTGTWAGCLAVGGDSEFTALTFSSRSNEVNLTTRTHMGVTDCLSAPDTVQQTKLVIGSYGTKSVPWDASGNPPGLSDPIEVSRLQLAQSSAVSKAVAVVYDSVSPQVLYLKTDGDGGPLDGSGYPDDITSDGPLVH